MRLRCFTAFWAVLEGSEKGSMVFCWRGDAEWEDGTWGDLVRLRKSCMELYRMFELDVQGASALGGESAGVLIGWEVFLGRERGR